MIRLVKSAVASAQLCSQQGRSPAGEVGYRPRTTGRERRYPTRQRTSRGPKFKGVVHRYYDPTTQQFLSVDPMLDDTETPYAFVDGDPVNAIDPNGLDCGIFSFACSAYDATAGAVKKAAKVVGKAEYTVEQAALPVVSEALSAASAVSSVAAAAALLAGVPELAAGLEAISLGTGVSAAVLDEIQVRFLDEGSTREVIDDLLTTVPGLGLEDVYAKAAFDFGAGVTGARELTAFECHTMPQSQRTLV